MAWIAGAEFDRDLGVDGCVGAIGAAELRGRTAKPRSRAGGFATSRVCCGRCPRSGVRHRLAGGYQVRGDWRDSRQRFERTGGGAHFAGGDQQISCCGAEVAMSEQKLNRAQIRSRLQQMNSESAKKICAPSRFARRRIAG